MTQFFQIGLNNNPDLVVVFDKQNNFHGVTVQLEKDAISAQSWLSVGKNLCSKHLFRCASDIATHCPPCPPRAIKTMPVAGNPTRRSIVESRIKDSLASSGRDRVGMGPICWWGVVSCLSCPACRFRSF